MANHQYYVYALLDPRKPGPIYFGHWKFKYEPFYIGKGLGARCIAHVKSENTLSHKTRKIKKIEATGVPIEVKFCKTGLTEKQAFKLETRLIHIIGRSDLGQGPLTNHTNGGQGMAGHVKPEETKRKLAVSVRESWKKRDTAKREASLANLANREWRKDPKRLQSAKEKLSKLVSEKHANMSRSEKERLIRRMRAGMRKYYDNRSSEERKQASDARRRSWETRRAVYGSNGRR